jgi:hypothetical protein
MNYSNLTDVELTYAAEVTNDALVALAKRQKFFAVGERMPGDAQLRAECTAFYAIAIEAPSSGVRRIVGGTVTAAIEAKR